METRQPEPEPEREEISYDDEQIHLFLWEQHQTELEAQRRVQEAERRVQEATERQERERLRIEQDEAYRESEALDRLQMSPEFEEVSVEEMRRVRLLRFGIS
jgi:hypothetical protein